LRTRFLCKLALWSNFFVDEGLLRVGRLAPKNTVAFFAVETFDDGIDAGLVLDVAISPRLPCMAWVLRTMTRLAMKKING
jgi:hypothetical protein